LKEIRFPFPKAQRLCREKIIKELFTKKSSSLFLYPFKVSYLPSDTGTTQILISVSKKRFKTAVKRNRVKRQIRELYRRSQYQLKDKPLFLAVAYVSDKIEKYDFLQKKWEQVILKIVLVNTTSLTD